MKIFDSLSHIKKDAIWYGTQHDASLKRLLKEFEKELDKTLLVGMPNDDINYLIEVARKHDDKFVPIAPIKFNSNASLEGLEKQILNYKNLGFKGIKIHPRFLNTNLADNKIINSIKLAGKYELVSLLCTVHRPPSKPLKRPLSDMIHEICDETQNSKTILLHGGYYDLFATSEVIRSFENVLLDLSATLIRFQDTHLLNDVKYLFKTFDKRLCIGSDFPEYTVDDILDVINKKIIDSDITSEKLENIYFNNLSKFMDF
jgi:predicted TIM-barrel fold metal-dependent hydrolase